MKVSKQIQDRVHHKILDCLKIASDELSKEVNLNYPVVTFDLNSIRTAGWFKYPNKLQLHGTLLNHYTDHYIERTVVHELAHYIVHVYFANERTTAHGKHWKYIMRMLGAEPSRCHSYDMTVVKTNRQTFKYACDCMSHVVGPTVHRRHQKLKDEGEKGYTCNKCKGDLVRAV